jgi:hypothetical protein
MSYVVKYNNGKYLQQPRQGELCSPYSWGSNRRTALRVEDRGVAQAIASMWSGGQARVVSLVRKGKSDE